MLKQSVKTLLGNKDKDTAAVFLISMDDCSKAGNKDLSFTNAR